MNWFEKMKKGLKTRTKRDIPDGVWTKCLGCHAILYRKELERTCWVCSHCGYHFRITGIQYVNLLLDEDTFVEMDTGIRAADPIKFRDRRRYTDRLRDAVRDTDANSAIRTGYGRIGGYPAAIGAMGFQFVGGSLGSVMGEKICRLIDRAMQASSPLVIVSSSGGARMQESAFSLMQMAKTAAKLTEFAERGLAYFSILADPTTGGTSASFAMLGDINIGEPGATIGLTGQPIIKETLGRDDLPEEFQRSEWVLEHGFLDLIVPRTEMRKTLIRLIELLYDGSGSSEEDTAAPAWPQNAKRLDNDEEN